MAEEPQIQEDLHIRYIKFASGEEILCQLVKDNYASAHEIMNIRFPMLVIGAIIPFNEEIEYRFMPWIPFAGIEILGVRKQHIITIVPVVKPIEIMYLNTVAKMIGIFEPVEQLEGTQESITRPVCRHRWLSEQPLNKNNNSSNTEQKEQKTPKSKDEVNKTLKH